MENENLQCVTFWLCKYDAGICITENVFLPAAIPATKSTSFPTTFTSLEHNIHISGSQLPYPKNTTVTDCRHSTVWIVLKKMLWSKDLAGMLAAKKKY